VNKECLSNLSSGDALGSSIAIGGSNGIGSD
jgi:hypothetical protein